MRALRRRQAAGDGFRLRGVSPAVHLFEGIDRRQHKGGAEATRQPFERPGPETRAQLRHALTEGLDLALPELGMRRLDRRKAGVDPGELRVFLGLGQGLV